MNKAYVTADTHFGHKTILKWCNRPFKTVEEMDEVLISNWNDLIDRGDIVYMLGDFAWRQWHSYFTKLNGQIHFIRGNHDKMTRSALLKAGAHSVEDLKHIKVKINQKRYYATLSHYAMRTWPKSAQENSVNLHGHSHGLLKNIPYIYDVGTDVNNFTPILLEDAIMKAVEIGKEINKKRKAWAKLLEGENIDNTIILPKLDISYS